MSVPQSHETPVKLKYLFVVEYTDGTTYEQTPLDRSKIDPEKRSEFYDVLQSGKTIKKFALVPAERGTGEAWVSVDLSNGMFEVNGYPIKLESVQLPEEPEKRELWFTRRHTHSINLTKHGMSSPTPNRVDFADAGHTIEYLIGWTCIINGKKYEEKIILV